MEGGTGNDLIRGGSGSDEFRFDLGVEAGTEDKIVDFVDGVDSLRFVDFFSNYSSLFFLDAATYVPGYDGTLVYSTDGAANNHLVYIENLDETDFALSIDTSGDFLIA